MKTLRIISLAVLLVALGHLRLGAIGIPEIVIGQPPESQAVNSGATVTFRVVANAGGLLQYQWRHGTRVIEGATEPTLTLTNVQLADAGEYVVSVLRIGVLGVDVGPAILTVNGISVQDLKGPEIRITSPANGFTRVSSPQLVFTGSANDDVGVIGICYQRDTDPWVQLPPSVDWMCPASLHPGTNIFHFKALDVMGNCSSTQKVVVFYSVTQPLTLNIIGGGQVVRDVNSHGFEIGRGYTFKAVAAAGCYFGWWDVNGVISTNPTLSFIMSSNMTVTANFVGNPFIPLRGTYTALFYDTNDPAHETSGLLTFSLTDQGRFSGKLVRGGVAMSCSGQFGMDLRAHQTIVRPSPNPSIVVELQLSADSDRVTGSVGEGAQSSLLEGFRGTFHSTVNPATNFAGKYTFVISGSDNSTSSPFGQGFSAVTVSAAGLVQVKGALSEGTVFTQKVPLASNGQWPLYVVLYKGKGSVLGWITFRDAAGSDLDGRLLWTKPAGAAGPFYPSGFVNEATVQGSKYATPSLGVPMLSLSDAIVTLEGGNLSSPTGDSVTLDAFNKVTVAAPNTKGLSLKLTASSGLISGSFLHPDTRKKSAIKGAALQRQNMGTGYFLGTNQSGSFSLVLPPFNSLP